MGWKEMCIRPFKERYRKQYQTQLEASQESFPEFLLKQREQEMHVQAGLTEEKQQEIHKIADDILFLQWKEGRAEEGAADIFARYFLEHPKAVAAYCDEAPELMRSGVATDMNGKELLPCLKPDWSPDLFLERFYFSGLAAVRKSALMEEKEELGGITPDTYLAKDEIWEFFYRLIKIKNGFNNRIMHISPVIHIPQILFWCSDSVDSGKELRLPQNITGEMWKPEAITGHEPGEEESAEESTEKSTDKSAEEDISPDVSIIIPSRDHPGLVETCIRSVYRTVKHLELEILVVDNGSNAENRQSLESLAEELGFTYLYRPMPFHFAKMCNLGAAQAKGKQLLFLNDDIECIHAGWLETMQEAASRPHVGAVGSKLLYPDGKRIQHAGIANLPIGPVHKLQFLPDSETYYDGYNRGIRNVLAVTGACLLLRRELYEECGGMSEELAVAFNDVELCFRLYEKGYYQVVLQDKPLIHHESLSRGDDEAAEKWKRLMQERAALYRLHPQLQGMDPFYPEALNRKGLDTQILPGYFQGKQEIEPVIPVLWQSGIPKEAREDSCLLLRAEICREAVTEEASQPNAKKDVDDGSGTNVKEDADGGTGSDADKKNAASNPDRMELYGYGVVLGSDNAHFSKELLLRREDSVYRIPFRGQIRTDLIRNMPDQQNIGLSGFWVTFGKNTLPGGSYELGMYAWDRFSRTKLYCFSGRIIEIEF